MIIFLFEEIFINKLFPFSLHSNFKTFDFLSLLGRSVFSLLAIGRKLLAWVGVTVAIIFPASSPEKLLHRF